MSGEPCPSENRALGVSLSSWCASRRLPFHAHHEVLGKVTFDGQTWIVNGTRYHFDCSEPIVDGMSDQFPCLECDFKTLAGEELSFQAYIDDVAFDETVLTIDCDSYILVRTKEATDGQQ